MHGNIRLSQNKKYLEYDDGTPFFWLADTWWYGMTRRMSFDIFKKLVKKRRKQGFTVIQIVVGIPPETEPFSKNSSNDGGHPFTKDWQINQNYFCEVDKKIKYLVDKDLIPCIVGNWGNHIENTGVETMKKFWAEIVKRYVSYPIIFCLTGEADASLVNAFPAAHLPLLFQKTLLTTRNILTRYARQKRLQKWDRVANYIKRIDSRHHLLTVHVQSQQSARQLFHDPGWLDINSFQSGHSKDRATFMIETVLDESKKSRPIINLEPWYEGILNNFGPQAQRYAFWTCILSGAKGHTYGAHGLWQMAKNDDDYLNHWGHSNWEKSVQYRGAEQLGIAKKILERFTWWKLSPCFEIVSPHWTRLNPEGPLAAHIENKYIFIYFPKVGSKDKFLINLEGYAPGILSWIDPTTMKTIKREQYSNQKLRPAFSRYPKNHDLLLVFQTGPNT